MIQPHHLEKRDALAELFLPENHAKREKLSDKRHREIVEALLGQENPPMRIGIWHPETPEEAPQKYLEYKEDDFKRSKNARYRRIFDLCRMLGITNIYDIGPEAINQSFQLVSHTNISYTGIGTTFDLIDWREKDREAGYYSRPYVRKAPPSLAGGRIRFMKGWYPDVSLNIRENNIAVASCSLTMCKGAETIAKTTAALARDFERILVNPPSPKLRPEDHAHWTGADWTGFSKYLFRTKYETEGRFWFLTKNPADIERIRLMYPADDAGMFFTGIN